jgi:hypothetical protein
VSLHGHIADRAADVALATSAVVTVGVTIADISAYLQAGGYAVSIISGLCAAVYYIKKIREK